MELVVLSIHLLVCICLIGLVLLQRSEGGALGMGGGGGGALMSGRGAADALAKMTSVAGGFFIVTSLSLTLIAGAANTGGRSVMDLLPAQTAPATTAPATTTEEPAAAPTEGDTPDPTEGRGPSVNEFALGPSNAEASTRTSAPAPSAATTRAGPIDGRPTQTAANSRQTTPVNTTATQPRTTPATTQRTAPATTQAVTQPTATPRTTPPATTSGTSVSGIDLTTDNQLGTESSDSDNGVAVVRRERAGPDQ